MAVPYRIRNRAPGIKPDETRRRLDRQAEQDIVLLKYMHRIGGSAEWRDFESSFDPRSHDFIRERLYRLTLKGHVEYTVPCDGYSDGAQTWRLTSKVEGRV